MSPRIRIGVPILLVIFSAITTTILGPALFQEPTVSGQSRTPGYYWTCSLDAIGATLTLCIAAPEPGMRRYITDVYASSTTTTSGLMLLRYGTGTNCGTGTTSVLPSAATVARFAYHANTLGPTTISPRTPIEIPSGKDLCIIGTATNTVTVQMIGYVAP